MSEVVEIIIFVEEEIMISVLEEIIELSRIIIIFEISSDGFV